MIRIRSFHMLWLIPGLLLCILLVIACSNNPASSGQQVMATGPYLHLPDTTFNFGIVPQNSIVSYDFSLVSAGTETVVIDRIVPG